MDIQRAKHVVVVYAAVAFLGCCSALSLAQLASQNLPVTWVDSETGHRITRLTNEPGSRSLYFNQNAFLPDGRQMIYLANTNIYAVTLTDNTPTRLLVPGPISSVIVGRKAPTVYFTRPDDAGFYAFNVDTGQTHKVLDLPHHAKITSLNADETLAAGTLIEGEPSTATPLDSDPVLREAPLTEEKMDARLAARLPMALFTINLQTAALKTLLRSNDWLDEVMFSPTDPTLLMYCHQGSWLKVDRLWTIRADGTGNSSVHQRTMSREAVGNAFWDADGKTIWYDLQAPLGQNFYLASYNVVTGLRQRYTIERNSWSVHYNAAVDDSAFCGDGSDSTGSAVALDGKWLELFFPRKKSEQTDPSLKSLIQTESFRQQHLANLSKQKYAIEPNARFTPDHRRVIFTSNMLGQSYVFAVEVAHDHTQPATASSSATL